MNNQRPGAEFGSANILLEPGIFDNLRLTWRLARDGRVAPVLKMIVPLAILLYVISPIDLVPDFLLGIGQIDDIGLLGVALLITFRLLPRLAPANVVAEHLTDMGLREPAPGPTYSQSRTGEEYVDTTYRVHDTPAGSR